MSEKKSKTKCLHCQKRVFIKRQSAENDKLCGKCRNLIMEHPECEENSDENLDGDENKANKSTNKQLLKQKGSSKSKTRKLKKENFRKVFKIKPVKITKVPTTSHLVDSLPYKGSYVQVGDIVSLIGGGGETNNTYYAQITALLVNTHCEKSAVITWLIPTTACSIPPNEGFDASTYLIGFAEDTPRELSCMEFVMHAPSSYYHDKKTSSYSPAGFMHTETPITGFVYDTVLAENERNLTEIAVNETKGQLKTYTESQRE